MTTENETDPRDDALAKAWRAQSQEMPPPALDAAILASAHRAVGSGPRGAGKEAAEATRPQRWWMPLAAAATIGVVVIGILQIAPQAPIDIVVGERAEVTGRVAPAAPATPTAPAASATPAAPAVPAKDIVSGNIVGQAREAAPAKNLEQAKAVAPMPATPTPLAPSTTMPAPGAREKRVAPETTSAPPPPAAAATLADARRQVAQAPPQPEPFPADKLSNKADTQSTLRQNERKDAGVAPSAPAPSMLAPAPMKKESAAGAAGSLAAADNAAKPAPEVRERDAAREDASARNVPAAASAEQARGGAGPAELQARARDPEAWIARIRKLRAEGRVAEAVAELRDFRRYVPDAETRLPTDLRQWVPSP